MNKKKPFPQLNGNCRICGRTQPAGRKDFFRAGGLRCPACGGLCDPDRPLFKRSTPRHTIVRVSKIKNKHKSD